MPVFLPQNLPAVAALRNENLPVFSCSQPDGALQIALLNLMPTKEVTECQLLRLLANSPLPIAVTLLHMESHVSKNTDASHLSSYYEVFSSIKNRSFDGLIITGAPVEQLPFEEVDYWDELCRVMEWSKTHVRSTLHICWGAQAGLYYHYGIDKHPLPQKLSGIYTHRVLQPNHPLLRGFDDVYLAPHSRHTGVSADEIAANPNLSLLTVSDDAGVHIVAEQNGRSFFVTGHSEYDRDTLLKEYQRDVGRGLNPHVPVNYLPEDDPTRQPPMRWRAYAQLLFTNWVHNFVAPRHDYDQ